MNYWPAEPVNLADCAEPLFDALGELMISGREVARAHYNARRLGSPPQLRPLARHGADQRLGPWHLGLRRRLAMHASVGSLPLQRRQGLSRPARLPCNEGSGPVLCGLSRRRPPNQVAGQRTLQLPGRGRPGRWALPWTTRRFGRIADPLADRLLIDLCVILAYQSRLAWWLALPLLLRDAYLAISSSAATWPPKCASTSTASSPPP